MLDAIKDLLATPRDPDPPHRSRWDWLLVALIASVALFDRFQEDATWASVRLTIMVVLALPWRRSHPLQVTVVYSVVFVLVGIVNLGDELFSNFIAGVVITYALFRWASGRGAVLGFFLLVAVYTLHQVLNVPEFGFTGGAITTGFWLLPAAIGGAVREARRRISEEARFREREELARELHDTVAHEVSALIIQSQAARVVADSQPEAAVDALQIIEETASRALAEMRKVVGSLRSADASQTAPRPRLEDIKRLAEHAEGGPQIDVRFSGQLDTLAPSVEVGLYRIAQESITNARRHATNATRIAVHIDRINDDVRLTVTDDGDVDTKGLRLPWGYGLSGMSERAALLGGRLDAGPEPEGGWRVRVVLPNAGA